MNKLITRFRNPAFYSAIVGLAYLIAGDLGFQISANHWDHYVAFIAILVGVYSDHPTTETEKQEDK
jgi:uncharacterized membrane protein